MGLRAGILTAWGNEIALEPLQGITVLAQPAEHSTTFENVYMDGRRVQTIRQIAPRLDLASVPETWRHAPILHLAPVAQELDPWLPDYLHPTLLGLSAQGWLRGWDAQGHVNPTRWRFDGDPGEAVLSDRGSQAIQKAGAVFISAEDVGGDEHQIEEFMLASRLLAVTEGGDGARLYWNGDLRRFRAPRVTEVDATGAGDIFAAAFLVRLYATRDPWEACRFACRMAAISVTRPGLAGVPTPDEIQACLAEVLT
jgi:sugar/nucleoside kinase (ribokinase family)